jgi:hypothetical protein
LIHYIGTTTLATFESGIHFLCKVVAVGSVRQVLLASDFEYLLRLGFVGSGWLRLCDLVASVWIVTVSCVCVSIGKEKTIRYE